MNNATKTARLWADDDEANATQHASVASAQWEAQKTSEEWHRTGLLDWEQEGDNRLVAHCEESGGKWTVEGDLDELADEWAQRLEDSLEHDDREGIPDGWEVVVTVKRPKPEPEPVPEEGVEVPGHVLDHLHDWINDNDGLFESLHDTVHYAMECVEDWDLPEMHDLDVYVTIGKRTLDLSD